MGNLKDVLGCTNRAKDLEHRITMMRLDYSRILILYFDATMNLLAQQRIKMTGQCLVYEGLTLEAGKPPVELPQLFLRKPVWEVIAYMARTLPEGTMAHVTPLGDHLDEVGVVDPLNLPRPDWA